MPQFSAIQILLQHLDGKCNNIVSKYHVYGRSKICCHHMKCKPERTHWRPSKKFDVARSGIMMAMYLTTSVSLLYAYPHTLRINIMTNPNTSPSITATVKTTYSAKRASWGWAAPSSFETRVLRCTIVWFKKQKQNWKMHFPSFSDNLVNLLNLHN